MEPVWLDTAEGQLLCLGPASKLAWDGLPFMAVEQRSELALLSRPDRSCVGQPRKPGLLLLPGCQAVKIKIKDLDSRPLCDCTAFFF